MITDDTVGSRAIKVRLRLKYIIFSNRRMLLIIKIFLLHELQKLERAMDELKKGSFV